MKVLHKEWALAKAMKRSDANKRSLGQQLRQIKKRSEHLMKIHDDFEKLCIEAFDWMKFIDFSNGKIRTGKECAEGLKKTAEKMKDMKIPRITSIAKYLYKKAGCLTSWVDELGAEIEKIRCACRKIEKKTRKNKGIFHNIKSLLRRNDSELEWKDFNAADLCCWFFSLREAYEKSCHSWDKRKIHGVLIGLYAAIESKTEKHAYDLIQKASLVIRKRY